ncbi:hypothetical protein [Methylobacterium sp. J-077]|uniref:hypothetical protein n=1 Tax=Methylobacterium sp. J-077 TaxID=2836656 RepID=UPI001FBB42CD|nr:hypothetical protein [Methylobacterium sp. J-077]MCJ2121797.1 hypothetical protein [Methylobacterium sp. J-077]
MECARVGDRRPEGRLAISGILRIESEEERAPYVPGERRHRYVCADLCLAALLTPGIRGVVIGEPSHDGPRDATSDSPEVLYRLVRTGGCPNTERFEEYTFPFQGGGTVPGLRTRGTLALAAGACLEPSRAIPAADWTIRYGRETLHDAPWSGTLVGRIDRRRLSLDEGSQRRLQPERGELHPAVAVAPAAADRLGDIVRLGPHPVHR